MMNVGTIYYEVASDTSKLVNGGKAADTALDGLEKQFAQTDKAAAKSQHQMTATAKAVKQLGDESSRASRPIDGMTKMLAGLLSVGAVNGLIQMAEAYNEMAERIRFATSSQAEYEMVQERLLAVANSTYRSMKEAQEVYILTADSLRSMGYTTEQVLDITDSMAYSFVKNATAVDRAQAATRAYTNAINKGKVEADGWMTIVAAIPTVIQDIAAASGKSAAEIREMGASGKLTAQMLNEGLRQALGENKKAADGMATTVRDAFTNIRNNLAVFLGEMNEATGATGILSAALIQVGNNIETLSKLLGAVAAGALAVYILRMGTLIATSARALMASRAQALEELRLAQAHAASTAAAAAHAQANAGLTGTHAAATAASNAHAAAQARLVAAQAAAATGIRGLIGLLGGPAGLVFLLGSAAAAVLLFGDNAKTAKTPIDQLSGSIETLGARQLALRAQKVGESIEIIERQAREADNVVKALERDYAKFQKDAAAGRISAKELDNVRRTLVEERAAQEQVNEELRRYQKLKQDIADQESKLKGAAVPGAPAQRSDPEVLKRLAAMRQELELAKLQGEARAKLQAIQKLGENATAAERAEAERLAVQIYRLEQAQKKLKKTTKEGAAEAKQNAEVLANMREELAQSALAGEALAVAKAKAKLNKFATPEEIAEIERLARALFQASEQAELLQMKRAAAAAPGDEVQRRNERFQAIIEATPEAQLERQRDMMRELAEAYEEGAFGIAGSADAIAKYTSAVNTYLGNAKTESESWAKQAAENIQGYLGQGLYDLMSGNFKSIGDSFVQMLNRMVSEAAAADLAKYLLGDLVKGGSGSGLLGDVLKAGGNIITGVFGGFRAGGGYVQEGKAYRVNESGAPEVLNVGARQWLLPTKSGVVEKGNSGASKGRGDTFVNNFYQPVDSRTANQVALRQSMQQKRSIRLTA